MKKVYRKNLYLYYKLWFFMIFSTIISLACLLIRDWPFHFYFALILQSCIFLIFAVLFIYFNYRGEISKIVICENSIRQKMKGTWYEWKWEQFSDVEFVKFVSIKPPIFFQPNKVKGFIVNFIGQEPSFSIMIPPNKISEILHICTNEPVKNKLSKICQDVMEGKTLL